MSDKLIAAMSTNVNIGIDEVVSIFVAKHEDQLFNKKQQLSAKVRDLKKSLEDLAESMKSAVDTSKYMYKLDDLGLTTVIGSIDVLWDGDRWSHIGPAIEIPVMFVGNKKESAEFTKDVYVPIAEADIASKKALDVELELASAELADVLAQLKAISRKERQLRGKISEMKLEQSGMGELLNNPEMLKLVNLD